MQSPPLAYPLRGQQQTFWRYPKQSSACRKAMIIPFAIRICGPLDRERLRRSLQGVIDRHAPLSTRFEEQGGRVVQVVETSVRIEVETARCPDLPSGARALAGYLKRISPRSVGVRRAPLLRAQLVERSSNDHVLFLTAHHLVFDGVSALIFYKELIKRYGCAEPDDPSALAPLKGSYRDYVVWQEAMASGPVGLAYQEYTRAMLPEILDEIPTV